MAGQGLRAAPRTLDLGPTGTTTSRLRLWALVAAPFAVGAAVVVGVSSFGPQPVTTAASDTESRVEKADVPASPQEAPLPDTFAPIVLQGTGNSVQPLAIPATTAGDVIMTVEHGGTSNFLVWTLDATMAHDRLAINEIGTYTGSVLMTGATAGLDIKADGPWTITIRPVSDAPAISGATTGTGNAVLRYVGPRAAMSVQHTWTGKMALWEHPGGGSARLLLLESGDYTGDRSLSAGPNVLIIEADGEWTLTVR